MHRGQIIETFAQNGRQSFLQLFRIASKLVKIRVKLLRGNVHHIVAAVFEHFDQLMEALINLANLLRQLFARCTTNIDFLQLTKLLYAFAETHRITTSFDKDIKAKEHFINRRLTPCVIVGNWQFQCIERYRFTLQKNRLETLTTINRFLYFLYCFISIIIVQASKNLFAIHILAGLRNNAIIDLLNQDLQPIDSVVAVAVLENQQQFLHEWRVHFLQH
mmetsp:Transcript_45114/g.74779  ORF Transcript_45114/g.74779 Transcript_45114/m.74779 type:complete len:219 (+) Transcript_45114:2223-2879(+)